MLYFLAVGHLDDFVQAFVLINAEYTEAARRRSGVVDDWGRVVRGYGASTVILVGGLVALPALAVAAHRRSDPAAPLLTGLSVGTADRHRLDGARLRLVAGRLPGAPAGRRSGPAAPWPRWRGGSARRRGIALVVAWSLVATGTAR